jgi:signal transduction histidine kinase/ActR/RegA family two-component response regulator
MRLRSHLTGLMLVGVIPLIVLIIALTFILARQQRSAVERGLADTIAALAAAIDNELGTSLKAMETLATSTRLDDDDLPSFYEQARRVRDLHHWSTIGLIDLEGNHRLNVARPFGSPLPNLSDRSYFKQVVATKRPYVSDLLVGRVTTTVDFAAAVPVFRDGTLKYVLFAGVNPGRFQSLFQEQGIPARGIASIISSDGVFVSRSHDAERVVAQAPLGPYLARILETDHGVVRTPMVAGEGDVYAAFQRLRVTPWTVGLSVPATAVEAPVRRIIWGGVIIGAAVVLGAVVIASIFAHRTATAIGLLTSWTSAVGRGEHVTPPPRFEVSELEQLRQFLASAEQLIQARTKDREQLLAVEQARAASADREREARLEAEAANRSKDEFLMVLSHELRTPINAVYGWARMLQGTQLDEPEMRRAIEAIVRNANAQVQLIDDLLDVSRIVSGKLRLDVRTVDLAAVAEAALDSVRPAAAAKDIRLQSILDPFAGPVTGDPARLQQVLWNLLTNAIKFTPRGGRVQIHLQRVNSHIEIVVSDTGQGIAPDLLPVIFDRFRQADSSSTRSHGGLGLGLALARHLVDAHGGTLTAQSPGENQGATFTVKLPLTLARVEEQSSGRAHPIARVLLPAGDLGPKLDGVRILVVDDELDALDLATTILTAARGDVRTCASAAEALRVFTEWRPDVLVADIEMPDEDGLALIRKIRALPPDEGGKVPAVALTAYGRASDRIRTLSAGFSMHVPKPVDPAELTVIVANLAGRDDRGVEIS